MLVRTPPRRHGAALPLLLALGASLVTGCDAELEPGRPDDGPAADGASSDDAGNRPEADAGAELPADGDGRDAALADAQVQADAQGPLVVDAGNDSAPDAATRGDAAVTPDRSCIDPGLLDVLFVIDNSKSMQEEQGKLAELMPRLATILATGDSDLDGSQDFRPVDSLHLGVITTDMGGSGTTSAPSCDGNAGFGDDGVLIAASRSLESPCAGVALEGTRHLSFVPGSGQETEQVVQQLACLASVGIDGCGFEQPLEAMYKALAPDSVSFARQTTGHGNQANAGFLRDDATLVVIHVSDEDDCSITDQGVQLYLPESTGPGVSLPGTSDVIGLNLRCGYKAEDPTLIHPVQRYVDGLLALKPGHSESVIFAAIVGIPPAAEALSFDEILAHPDMVFGPDPDSSTGGDPTSDATPARPVCRQLEGEVVVTNAVPARRFVQTARGFGENGVLRSICGESFEAALGAVVERIAARPDSCELY